MDTRRYDVIFSGELVEGSNPAEVRRRLAALFKSDEAAVERLFSGQAVVIKKAVDEATAARYREAMRQAGAVCRLRIEGDVAATEATASPVVGEGSLAGVAILPAGELLPQSPQVEPPHFDLDGFSLAAIGVDLAPPSTVAPRPLPDISGITLAPPGSDLTGRD
jgi:hypothetical protein